MSGYTLTAGRPPVERLDLVGLLDRQRAEVERLAGLVIQQIAWLDANREDALYEPRWQIWNARWEELREKRGDFQDHLVGMEVYATDYFWRDIERGIYDRGQADEEVSRLRELRSWWDASPIKTMHQFDNPNYGPCPF